MKKYYVVLFIICFFGNALNSAAIDADSKIVHVIVYPEWAFVTRMTDVVLQKGTNSISFKGLPAWIDTNSIQVKLSETNDFKILSVNSKDIYLRQIAEKEVRDAYDKVVELNDTLENINTEISVLKEEEKYLTNLITWNLEKVPHESAARKVEISELQNVNSYIKTALLDNLNKKNVLMRKIRDLTPELEVLKKKWNELQSKANLEQKEITIDIDCETQGKTKVYMSYLISGASWYPNYDARTDTDKKQVDISCYANVQQTTGEDWSDATFTLSTIKPYLIQEKPELNPWYVNTGTAQMEYEQSFNRSANEESYSKLKSIQKKQMESNKADAVFQQALSEYNSNLENMETVVKQTEERGTTVEFMLTGKYSVKTDGKPIAMPIGNTNIEAVRQYSSIPAVSKNTYIECALRNTGTFPLLPGEVKVYKSGNFIGKSKIDFVAVQEKFSLYTGLEERIKVSRILDTKKSSTSFTGSKRKMKLGYIIEINNFLKDPAEIAVSDQIPVSQSDDVRIKTTLIDPKVDKVDNGIINWKVTLNPMEKKTLYLEYEIEYPENVRLDNANEIQKQLYNMQ